MPTRGHSILLGGDFRIDANAGRIDGQFIQILWDGDLVSDNGDDQVLHIATWDLAAIGLGALESVVMVPKINVEVKPHHRNLPMQVLLQIRDHGVWSKACNLVCKVPLG